MKIEEEEDESLEELKALLKIWDKEPLYPYPQMLLDFIKSLKLKISKLEK